METYNFLKILWVNSTEFGNNLWDKLREKLIRVFLFIILSYFYYFTKLRQSKQPFSKLIPSHTLILSYFIQYKYIYTFSFHVLQNFCQIFSSYFHLFPIFFLFSLSTFISSLVFFCPVFIVSLTCKYIHSSLYLFFSCLENSFQVFFVFALATTYLHSLSFLSSSCTTLGQTIRILFDIIYSKYHIESYN